CRSYFSCCEFAAEVGSTESRSCDAFDGLHQSPGCVFFPEMLEHQPAVHNAAMGLAIPLPVMSKAVPWVGSNMEGKRRSGSRLAVGAFPRLPAKAAARSER